MYITRTQLLAIWVVLSSEFKPDTTGKVLLFGTWGLKLFFLGLLNGLDTPPFKCGKWFLIFFSSLKNAQDIWKLKIKYLDLHVHNSEGVCPF